MANKAFEIQESKLRIGGLDLEAGATAIAIPGLSQAATYFVEEVDERDGNNPDTFGNNSNDITVIDNSRFLELSGTPSSASYVPAEYSVDELDDGQIEEINVEVEGVFESADKTRAEAANMWATAVQDPFIGFSAGDWAQIPFRPKVRAGVVENLGGGGADLGDFSIDGSELSADSMTIKTVDGDITIESDSSVLVDVAGGTLRWSFANDGILTLPEGGDIVNSTGSSVLGGGGGSSFNIGTVNLHNGGNQTAQILQFTDDQYQSVITGPTAPEDTDAQRLIIQGQRGTGTGEGGDVYLWGGDAQHNGGDIKIYAGDADSGTAGDEGGYINIQAGVGYSNGGDVTITGGYSANGTGGNIRLQAGNGDTNGEIQFVSGSKQLTFDTSGNLELLNGSFKAYTSTNYSVELHSDGIDFRWNDEDTFNFGMGPGGGSINTETGKSFFLGISGGEHSWEFDIRGALRLPIGGDILDSNGDSVLGGGSGATTVARQDTPPATGNGTLWYNTLEGRLYIKYADAWVDAAPLMMPAPQTDIDIATITFPDASIQTTAFTGFNNKLVNGVHEVVLDSIGDLLSANDIITVPGGRFIKDCGNSTSTTSLRWINLPAGDSTQIIRLYTEDPRDIGGTSLERAQIGLQYQSPDQSGWSIMSFDHGDGGTDYTWEFRGDGTTQFPNGIIKAPPGDNTVIIQSENGKTDIDVGNSAVTITLEDTTAYTWTYGTDGILTLPSNSYLETSDTNLKVGSQGTVTIRSNAATVEGTKAWAFNTNGSITFPDATVQTTAFTSALAQGQYTWTVDGSVLTTTPTTITYNLFLLKPAIGYLTGDDYTLDISGVVGSPGQRLVVVRYATLCNLTVITGEGNYAVADFVPAEFIYISTEGWAPLYGATVIP